MNFAIVFLLVAIVGTQATKCPPKCRDTVLTEDFTDRSVEIAAYREHLENYWKSKAVPKLTPLGQEFINEILSRNGTDSYTIIQQYYFFTVRCNLFFVLARKNPGFCFLARNVNASTLWIESGEGQSAVDYIKTDLAERFSWCLASVSESLRDNGCKKLPKAGVRCQSDCFNKGKTYDIKNAINYFGRDLPCAIQKLVLKLYDSCDYNDNLLAVTFVSCLTPITRDLLPLFPLNELLEIQNAVINPTDDKSCCDIRKERFTNVCRNLDKTDFSGLIQKYSTPCP